MNPFKLVLFFLLLGQVNDSFSQEITKEGLITDLHYFRDSLSVKHKNLFAKISKDEFLEKCNNLEKQIPSISTERFIVELFKINALIADEHTIIFPPDKLIFPIKFGMFNDGVAILKINSANKDLLLSELLEINGRTIKDIQNRFKECFKQDNESYFKMWFIYFLNRPSFLKGLEIVTSNEFAKIKVVTSKGDTVMREIHSVLQSQLTDLSEAPQYTSLLPYTQQKNYWYDAEKYKGVIYFNFMRCSDNKELPFEVFNKKLFVLIDSLKPGKLIVDLRFNDGGNSAVLSPFIESIKKSYLNKEGKLFVLIGRTTFSSSLMNAVELKRNTKAILVGETTGGNINHFGEIKAIELPNTKIRVNYSTKFWVNWKNHDGALQPDKTIEYSFKKFRQNIDEAIQYILEL